LRLFHADAINLWGIENESGSGFAQCAGRRQQRIAPLQDIGISGDRITAIAAGLPDGGESLDVAGGLVSGGLIETQFISTSRGFSTAPSRHPTAAWII